MSPDRLIYMANQIGKFFQSQGHDKAVPGIADHIRKFWDPRMRKAIFAHMDSGGSGARPQCPRRAGDAEEGCLSQQLRGRLRVGKPLER